MAKIAKTILWLSIVGLVGAVAGYLFVLPHLGKSTSAPSTVGLTGDAKRGEYLATAAGCFACHTDYKKKGKLLAGGPAIKTPFGTFYGPNITPDKKHGIGDWSLQQFARALTNGISPDGNHYFPSFPYTSYAAIKPQDIADIKTYLDTVSAVSAPSRPHDLSWPFSERKFVGIWKWMNFNPAQSATGTTSMDRGAYLVNVLGHCAECHTQRNQLGGKTGVPLAGNSNGPGSAKVPGIRSPQTDGAQWNAENIVLSLQLGMKPNGDFVGDTMAEVVEHSTSKLRPEDRAAIATYLLSLK